MKRVVVTGMGVASHLGDSVASVFDAWRVGDPKFSQLSSTSDVYTPIGGISRINLRELPDRKIQKATTRKDVLGVLAGYRCFLDSGLQNQEFDVEASACYVGSSSTQIDDMNPYLEAILMSMQGTRFSSPLFGSHLMDHVNPMVMMQNLMNNILCYLSRAINFRGCNANFVDFQAAGMRALVEGYQSVATGRAERAICGASAGTPEAYHAEQGVAMGYLLPREQAREGVFPKPFSSQRSGTVLSEGAAFLMLEEREVALARGATIHAEIDQVGLSHDGCFAYVESDLSRGLATLYKDLLNEGEETLIVAAANGSIHGDAGDAYALGEVLAGESVHVSTPKAVLGETSEASGPFAAALAIEAMRRKCTPGIGHEDELHVGVAGLKVLRSFEATSFQSALALSRGFNGTCAAVKLKQHA